MNNKKISWLLALLTVFTLVFSACSPSQATPITAPAGADATATTAGEAPAPDATEETITIVVWDFGGDEFSWMDKIVIPAYEELHPNIKIEHVGVPEDDLGTKLETAIAANAPPDLVVFPPTRVLAAGHVLPLDDYMARDGLKRADYCTLFESRDVFHGGGTNDNKVMSLPIDTNIWGMMYNKDLFAEAGLPMLGPDDVIDFDTWLQYARAINKPAENIADRVWGSNLFFPIWNSMNNYMSDPYVLGDDGRTCLGNAETEDWVNFWNVQVTAYQEDLTTWTAGSMLTDVQEDMFLQGKIGMTEAAMGDAFSANEQGLNVGLTGQPVVSKGWEGNVGGWNTSYNIMSATKHPEEAWQFLKYLSTEVPLNGPGWRGCINAGGGGLPGLPCYLPLLDDPKMQEMTKNNQLVADAVKLMQRIKVPPFTPAIWTSLSPFNDGFTAMTEQGVPVVEALHTTAQECQDITDEQWSTFEAILK